SVNSLTRDMMDFGSLSSPAFFDYNGDGLMDILVGSGGYKVEQGYEPSLILLENTGTATDPSFSIVDYDYLNISDFTGEKNFAPCFGDLDNDQDEDLLIGLSDGHLIYLENEGGAGNAFLFGSPQVEWKGLDVGLNSAPFIIDLDRDGDQDLVIGERFGNLNFIKNIGSPEIFECDIDLASPNNNTNLGDVDATEVTGGIVGNSSPLFLEIEDHYELILGTQSGKFFRYTDVDQNLDEESAFTLVNDSLAIVHTGSHTSMALADLNGNGKLECIVGNNRGGLSLYGSDLAKEYIFLDQKDVEQNDILATIYPNPVKNQVYISLGNKHNLANVKIYDASGRLVLVSSDSNVDCTSLKAGIYLVEVSSTKGFKGFNRFVKQ
ncbi:MAG: T9SS type A sorting domain-containing protein, partial [Flavobacteriaceae bacterium]|nr:T9SS type A sorting domain-containing protein [Flavobacteriaceae bacterium]